MNITPVSVRLRTDRSGRPSGEADVEFGTHEDAVKAMTKDKANMRKISFCTINAILSNILQDTMSNTSFFSLNYEGGNFKSGFFLFNASVKEIQDTMFYCPMMWMPTLFTNHC